MNTQRFLIALTVVNVASLAISLARPGASGAEGVDGQVKLIKP